MSDEGRLWAMNWKGTERVASIPFKERKNIKKKTSFKTTESRGHSDRDFSGFSKFPLKKIASMVPQNWTTTNSFHVLPNSVVCNHPPIRQ